MSKGKLEVGREYNFSMRSGLELLKATVVEVVKEDNAVRVRASEDTKRLEPQLHEVKQGEVVRLWLPFLEWSRA